MVPCIIMSNVVLRFSRRWMTGMSAGKRTPPVISHGRLPTINLYTFTTTVKTDPVHRVFFPSDHMSWVIFLGTGSTWMGHLADCWLGPVLCLTCGLWPSFQTVLKKENRMRKPFDSAHLCVWLKVRQRGKSRHVEKKIIHWCSESPWPAAFSCSALGNTRKRQTTSLFHNPLHTSSLFLWNQHSYTKIHTKKRCSGTVIHWSRWFSLFQHCNSPIRFNLGSSSLLRIL